MEFEYTSDNRNKIKEEDDYELESEAHVSLESLGGGVVVEDVTIEIPPWDDFYGFGATDPRSMEWGNWDMGGWSPSPVDATLFGGYNPLAQSFD